MSPLKKFQQNMLLIEFTHFVSHRGKLRTSKATKMEISVSTTNDSQPLSVFLKNFVLDATGRLDPHDRL